MGRPKKRQRQDEEGGASSQPYVDPALTATELERSNFENVCPGPLASSIRNKQLPRNALSSLNNTPPSDQPRTPSDSDTLNIQYPTDYSMWPDFGDITLPVPVQESYSTKPSQQQQVPDPDTDPSTLASLPAVPDCPCLPNLYLTLSTLSTLSAFPVSSHTITTLQSSHRTAHSVIYCPVCPQKYQSGSQNVMLSNTLITVLVDQWARILRCSVRDLEKGFSSNPPSTHISTIAELEWRTFAHDLVRAHVFGDRSTPAPPTSNPASNAIPPPQSQLITLMSLADSMERRQRQWHGHEPQTGEFPEKMTPDLSHGHSAGFTLEDIRKWEQAAAAEANPDKIFLCLQLVEHAKSCIRRLDKPPPVLGDCGLQTRVVL